MSPLITAVLDFEDCLTTFEALLDAFDQVGGDHCPSWVMVMRAQVDSLNQAFKPISTLSRAHECAAMDAGVLQ